MLLSPSILALILVSGVISFLLLLASIFAIKVVRYWDIGSGSELQLELERKTYLISTIVAYSFTAELVALLLFIYNAEQMSSQFVGAMCATGVLNINEYGWPTLYLKMALFFAGAVWLILNSVDSKARDYPLIRIKYGLLLLIAPLVFAEAITQFSYFVELNPDVITSCCGSLFTPEGEGVAAEVSGIEPSTAMYALIGSALALFAVGGFTLWRGQGGLTYSAINGLSFFIALAAIVSCIALYVYEHPHHHCPFCILKSGHDFVGYYLYIPLFIATAFGLGAGAIAPFRSHETLKQIVAVDSRRYIKISLVMMFCFYLVAAFAIGRSNLTMMEVWW